jgi:hypothetical protein
MYLPNANSIQVTDVHPSYMRSYYVETLTGLYSLGCAQREKENPGACYGVDNSLYFGYQQFRARVVSDSRINSFLLWGADMKYYRGAP